MNAKLEIVAVEQPEIIEAFKVEGGTKALFERIANNARSVVFDMGIKKERESLKSFAYSLARIKTTVDNHGKELVSGIKQQAAVIDADRKFWRDHMESLQDEIRKPLTDFEQAEKDRIQAIQDKISQFDSGRVDTGSPLPLILSVIAEIEAIAIDESFAEYQEQAKLQKYECLEVLRKVQVDREKYEAEQAELERLRQAEILRQQQEREAQIAREAAEKATREAEEKARFEAERVQREKVEAEQREARLKAEKEAAVLREQALKQKAIDDAKQAEIAKQQAIESERKRIEAEQAAKAEAERKAEEARKADIEHRRWINNEVLIALKSQGFDEANARKIISVIAKNQIPHVSIKY